MFKNVLKVMLRNLKKYRAFSAINILGLAFGMACCLLILMVVADELSYDRYNLKGDRIFRLNSHSTIGGTTRHFAASPAALAPAIKESIPEVLAFTRVFQLGRAQFVYEGRNIDIPDAYAADEDFFNIFSYEFLAGDPGQALKKPDSLVLTESAAVQIFGTRDALGKIITINPGQRRLDFIVSGVIRDVPKNSHFRFNVLNSTNLFRNPAVFPAGRPHLGNGPEQTFPFTQEAESTGIRTRNRPDEVPDLPCAPVPVDLSVRGAPPAVIGGLCVVLRPSRSPPLPEKGKNRVEHPGGGPGSFLMKGPGRVFIRDRDLLLDHDVAVVRPGCHVMQGHAGFGLAFDQNPVDRAAAPVPGEKGPVEVQASRRRDTEKGGLDEVAIVKGKENIRLETPDPPDPHRVVDVLGHEDRDAAGCGKLGHRLEPDRLAGIVPVGEHRRDLEAVSQQGLDADAAYVVVS